MSTDSDSTTGHEQRITTALDREHRRQGDRGSGRLPLKAK
jgi:hypothetical protein